MTTVYPELQSLVDLGAAGWRWLPPMLDDDGEIFEIRGVRTWPGGWADALRLRDSTDAKGVRCDPNGHPVWSREGTVLDVVDGLLSLPNEFHRM